MTTATLNYGFLMPDPGGSANTWGNILNGATQAIDAQMQLINNQVEPSTLSVARGSDGGAYGVVQFINAGNTQVRWILGETSEAEGAGNTGTNFILNAYDNSGAYLGEVFEVTRSNQSVAFLQTVTVGGDTLVSGNLSVGGNGSFSAGVVSKNGSVVSQAASGADSIFYLANSSGANTGYITWNHVDNSVVFGNPNGGGAITITSDAATRVGSLFYASGDIWTYGGGIHCQAQSVGNSNFWFVRNDGVNMGVVYYIMPSNTIVMQNQIGGGQISIDGVGNTRVNGPFLPNSISLPNNGQISCPSGGILLCDANGSWKMTMGGAANFEVQNNNAFKPGGGSWGTLSDARIKNVTGEYELGLNEVLQLRPVTYTYKTDGAKEFVGLVAQEAEQIMPGMVGKQKGVIDGKEVDDLRTLDTSELLFALVNCVRQLKAEIEELKAAR